MIYTSFPRIMGYLHDILLVAISNDILHHSPDQKKERYPTSLPNHSSASLLLQYYCETSFSCPQIVFASLSSLARLHISPCPFSCRFSLESSAPRRCIAFSLRPNPPVGITIVVTVQFSLCPRFETPPCSTYDGPAGALPCVCGIPEGPPWLSDGLTGDTA